MAKEHRFPRALLDRAYIFPVLQERQRTRLGAKAVGQAVGKSIAHPLQAARSIARETSTEAPGRYTAAEKRLCEAVMREWERYGGAGYTPSRDDACEAMVEAIGHFGVHGEAPKRQGHGGGP